MQNEPVVVNGAVTVVASILAALFAKAGISSDGWATLLNAVVAVVLAGVAVWRQFVARSKVTPVAKLPAPPATPHTA